MKDFSRRMSAFQLAENIKGDQTVDEVVSGSMIHAFRHAQSKELRLVDSPSIRPHHALYPRPTSICVHVSSVERVTSKRCLLHEDV